MSARGHQVIDLSQEDDDMQDAHAHVMPASIFARMTPAAAAAGDSSRAAAGATSLCPVCQLDIDHRDYERHMQACLQGSEPSPLVASVSLSSASLSASSSPSSSSSSSSSSSLSAQIAQFQSLLASHSPHTLSQHAPQLQLLQSQLKQVLVPIATMGGVVNVTVRSSQADSMRDIEVIEDDEVEAAHPRRQSANQTASASTGRHVLTSRSSLAASPSLAASSPHPPSPSLSLNAHPSAVTMSLSPSLSHLPPHAAAAAASSSSSSPPQPPVMSPFVSEALLVASDEQLVRAMQREEEFAAAAARRAREEQADKEFQELLRREGTCAKCGVSTPDQLIQICDDASSQPRHRCEHKICHECLRVYLQHIVRRMTNPTDAASSSAAAASASSLTESDLVCPYPSCATPLSQWQMKRVLPAADFEQLLSYTLRNTMKGGAFVSCPNAKCQNSFEAVAGESASRAAAVGGETGLDGQPMSAAAKLHRSQHRFRCNECSTIFCGQCSASPYHDGFNCDQWKKYQTAKKCRFCSTGLTAANTAKPHAGEPIGHRAASIVGGVVGSIAGLFGHHHGAASSSAAAASPLLDVCNSDECIEKRQHACDRTLPCGHACGGIRGERTCLPCLKEDCPSRAADSSAATEDEYCSICYVEGVGQAPSIQLECRHTFHHSCITAKLARRWPGARITFGFLSCPLCKVEVRHASLTALLAPLKRLKADINAKATARLAFEGLDHDEAFTSPSGRYFNRKEDYAMDKFAYYICSKCQQPYFGGQRRWSEASKQRTSERCGVFEEAAQAGDEQFDASQLVCGGCTAGSDLHNCATHGKAYIEFKCKFCCSIATWYCWGNTHFCQECHRRQESGDYVTRVPLDDLPKCEGPGRCPVGGRHPPNGQEFTLGCGICRPRDG